MLTVMTTVSTSMVLQIKETVAPAIPEGQELHPPPQIFLISKTFNILLSQTYRLSTSPSHNTSYFQKPPNALSEHFCDTDTCHETIILRSSPVFSIYKNFQAHLLLAPFTYPSEFQFGLQKQTENTKSKTCKAKEISCNQQQKSLLRNQELSMPMLQQHPNL